MKLTMKLTLLKEGDKPGTMEKEITIDVRDGMDYKNTGPALVRILAEQEWKLVHGTSFGYSEQR